MGHCSTCGIQRPLRSKHCSLCGRCVSEFDHHCPVLMNCVGSRNKGLYTLFLSLLLMAQLLWLRLATVYLHRAAHRHQQLAALPAGRLTGAGWAIQQHPGKVLLAGLEVRLPWSAAS
eukprot:jgi/Astpho2/9700/e_gw1.00149.210.1_t